MAGVTSPNCNYDGTTEVRPVYIRLLRRYTHIHLLARFVQHNYHDDNYVVFLPFSLITEREREVFHPHLVRFGAWSADASTQAKVTEYNMRGRCQWLRGLAVWSERDEGVSYYLTLRHVDHGVLFERSGLASFL